MNGLRPKLAAVLVVGLVCGATLASAADTNSPGEELAERIRSAEPDGNSDVQGTLITTHGKEVSQVPVDCRVILKGSTWETEYTTSATTTTGAERLVIIHSATGPNEYLLARAALGAPLPKLSPISAADSDIPFAGSAFSLADLGLEFLHWPQQRQLPSQTRLSRACYVLESSNLARHGIVRVLSYIDQETGGPLIARAYDANGGLAKEFSLQGGSFKKVNGHWRLEKMKIRDYKRDLRTEWKFDIND
ncbi:MAG TPA: outer membrane lipoprotein-sorting protein [Verrucomicrobiae bacterium]|jgi:hypothetical protein|nr:outer membrane lipoprotein-sorting protein [Verrucomicrobiae bacterium]